MSEPIPAEEFFANHPSVSARLSDRITGFVIAQDDELAFETSDMRTIVRTIESGQVVVEVAFVDEGKVLGLALFDGASVGLHFVGGELVVLEDDDL